MPSDELGLLESISMALGGMIGGDIFAVLVVAGTAGPAAWTAFVAGGATALSRAPPHSRRTTRGV